MARPAPPPTFNMDQFAAAFEDDSDDDGGSTAQAPVAATTPRVVATFQSNYGKISTQPKLPAASVAPAAKAPAFIVVRLLRVPKLHEYKTGKGGVVLRDGIVADASRPLQMQIPILAFNDDARAAIQSLTEEGGWYRCTNWIPQSQQRTPALIEYKLTRLSRQQRVTDSTGTTLVDEPVQTILRTPATPVFMIPFPVATTAEGVAAATPIVSGIAYHADKSELQVRNLAELQNAYYEPATPSLRMADDAWNKLAVRCLIVIVASEDEVVEGAKKDGSGSWRKRNVHVLDSSTPTTTALTVWGPEIETTAVEFSLGQVLRLESIGLNTFRDTLSLKYIKGRTVVTCLGTTEVEQVEGEEATIQRLERYLIQTQDIKTSSVKWTSRRNAQRRAMASRTMVLDELVRPTLEEQAAKHKPSHVRVWATLFSLDTNLASSHLSVKCPTCNGAVRSKTVSETGVYCEQCGRHFAEGGRVQLSIKMVLRDYSGERLGWAQGVVAERIIGCDVTQFMAMSNEAKRDWMERWMRRKREGWFRLSWCVGDTWSIHDFVEVDIEREYEERRAQRLC